MLFYPTLTVLGSRNHRQPFEINPQVKTSKRLGQNLCMSLICFMSLSSMILYMRSIRRLFLKNDELLRSPYLATCITGRVTQTLTFSHVQILTNFNSLSVSDCRNISQTTRLDEISIKTLLLGDARTSCKIPNQINISISLLQCPRLTLNRRYLFQEKAVTTDTVPFWI